MQRSFQELAYLILEDLGLGEPARDPRTPIILRENQDFGNSTNLVMVVLPGFANLFPVCSSPASNLHRQRQSNSLTAPLTAPSLSVYLCVCFCVLCVSRSYSRRNLYTGAVPGGPAAVFII